MTRLQIVDGGLSIGRVGRSSPDSRPAFTLSELLVSMAILSALILLLFSVVEQTTRVWNTSEQRVDAFREARAALFMIARDLGTMVAAPDCVNNTTQAAPPDGTPDFNYFFLNKSAAGSGITISGGATPAEGDTLFFLTSQSAAAQGNAAKSDVCAVGYYLAYVSAPASASSSQAGAFKLFRYFKNSDDTFQQLKDYTASPPVSEALMQASSATDEFLARNVISFRVKAYDASMTPVTATPQNDWSPAQTPSIVEISLTAYNYSTANNFLTRADWLATGPRNEQSRQTFTTRVRLPQR